MNTLTILGDGAFGTACAQACAQQGHAVTLWCHNAAIASEIAQYRLNMHYLPEVKLHKNITPTTDLAHALRNHLVFEAIPMPYLRSTLTQCISYTTDGHRWISLTKGIEPDTAFLATEVIEDVLLIPTAHIAVLSGPSYALELAKNQLTALTIASSNNELVNAITTLLNQKDLVILQSSDTKGVQLIAALKNVCAIGIGILAGAGYGQNTQILLLMQLINEIKLIFEAYGISDTTANSTLYGIPGLGDLILTCFGHMSRNYKLGSSIGQNKTVAAALKELNCIPEGYNTLKSIDQLIEKNTLTLPCLKAINDVVNGKQSYTHLIDLLRP